MAEFLVKFIFRLLALLPLSLVHLLGVGVGYLTYWFSPRYARRMRNNLRQANLVASEAEFEALLQQSIRESGKASLEVAWIWLRPYQQVLAKVVSFSGAEHIEAAKLSGKPVILLTPHHGCFEICSLYVSELLPMTVLYREPKFAALASIMSAGRTRGQVQLAKADLSGVRLLYKTLKKNEAIGLLPDQVPSRGDGTWVDFFGRPAYTMVLVRRFIENTQATVLLTYSERLANGAGYEIKVEPLVFTDELSVEQQINVAVERLVAKSPSQYLWSYNRYKRPRNEVKK